MSGPSTRRRRRQWATTLHCLGCEVRIRPAQHEPHYGGLVHAFLDVATRRGFGRAGGVERG